MYETLPTTSAQSTAVQLPLKQLPLEQLPKDIIFQVCDKLPAQSIQALSETSWHWYKLCQDEVWERRLASHFGVRDVRLGVVNMYAHNEDVDLSYYNVLRRLESCKYTNELYICVHLQPTDSITAVSYTHLTLPTILLV